MDLAPELSYIGRQTASIQRYTFEKGYQVGQDDLDLLQQHL
jgi:hypothetical protein